MNIVVIKENAAAEELKEIIEYVDAGAFCNVRSVMLSEAAHFFSNSGEQINLIFIDISDSQASHDILRRITLPAPFVIVVPAGSTMRPLTSQPCLGIIKKPACKSQVAQALYNYYDLSRHFNRQVERNAFLGRYRQRFMLKKGSDFVLIKTDDIAYIELRHGAVVVTDFHNRKGHAEFDTLREVAVELDPAFFFKANRQFIINIKAVKKFCICDRVKLKVTLEIPCNQAIIISQDKAASFKNWVAGRRDRTEIPVRKLSFIG